MTEIQSAERDRQTRAEIARYDRKSRENIAAQDRETNKKLKEKEIRNKTIDTLVNAMAGVGKIINDYSWYNKNKRLLQDVGNFSYQAPYGTIGGNEFNAQLAVFNWVPVLPHTAFDVNTGEIGTQVDDTFVSALKNLYAQMRKDNSGARNFEYQDVAKYTLAIQSMYTVLAKFRKIYCLIKDYDPNNNLFGQKILRSLNIDPSMITDLPGLRSLINLYSKLLKTYSLPNDMSVVIRQVWLNSTMFKDNPKLSKTQYYTFEQCGYYYIEDATSVNLKFSYFQHYLDRETGTNALTLQACQDILKKMFDGLLNDPYAGLISGDIRKRFANADMLEFTEVTENDHLMIGTSEEVLSQIENLTAMRHTPAPGDYDITQDVDAGKINQQIPNKVIRSSATTTDQTMFTGILDGLVYVNMYKDDPTPDDNMVATRLSSALKAVNNGANGVSINRFTTGTEIVNDIDIGYTFKGTTGTFGYDTYWAVSTIINDNPAFIGFPYNESGVAQLLSLIAQFDWFPGFYILSGTATKPYLSRIIKEFKNYAVINAEALARLNRVAALSEYGLTDSTATYRS